MTNDELEQVAIDFFKDKIYTSAHIEDPDQIIMVFMPLGLMDQKQLDELRVKKVAILYEYLDQAQNTQINGMPIFFSMRYLTVKEWKFILKRRKEMEQAINSKQHKLNLED